MIEHRSISNLVQNSHPYGYRHGACVLSSLAYTFDLFVVDIFGTLSCGATLVTGHKELVLGNIGRAVKNLRINVVHCTPSILRPYPSIPRDVVLRNQLLIIFLAARDAVSDIQPIPFHSDVLTPRV